MKARDLTEFCMQMSLLLEAGISLDAGLDVLAEDAVTEQEKKMLLDMAAEIGKGMSLSNVLNMTGEFPIYVVKMVEVGEKTGTLDLIMRSLAEHYDKENTLAKTIKNAVTYPVIMIFMLLLVLFVLLTKVMPIFESVYKQLGAQLSPITKSAVHIGTVLSGAMLVIIFLLGIFALSAVIFSRKGHKLHWTENLLDFIKGKSSIANALAKRRLTAILAVSIQSGLAIEKGMELAESIVRHKKIKEKICRCKEEILNGALLYDSLKIGGVFDGIDLQMIKVGSRSGKLDEVFEKMSQKYENEVDNAVDDMIARFEPTVVIILALTVGLVLLSVMMPLVGIMATIG